MDLHILILSAYTNRRTDEYGGSLENRARFALETIRSIKRHAGEDFTLIYRLSADEDVPNGISIEEACTFAKWAEEVGADAINVSAGTWDSRLHKYNAVMSGEESAEGKNLSQGVATSMWVPPSYTPRGSLAHLAAEVKKHVTVPVIAVCGISPEMGEEILEKNEADFIAIGRQTIADPDYGNKLKVGKPETIRRCLRCNECLGEVMSSRGISCAVNPEAGKEFEDFTKIYKADEKKTVAIIGSGPAGLQAALTASERGHHVTLFEKSNRLGGALYYVGLPDFKKDYRDYTDYIVSAVKNSNVTIKLETEATLDILKEGEFDTILVATGANTSIPDTDGTENELLDPLKVLDGEIPEGDKIIVCGAGLVGCEVSMFLAEKGKKVTMIDKLPEPAMELAIYTRWVVNAKLAELGVDVKVNHNIDNMNCTSTECRIDDEEIKYEGDAVVHALGLKSDRTLLDNLRSNLKNADIIPIGDVNKPRKIIQAVHEGYHAARII